MIKVVGHLGGELVLSLFLYLAGTYRIGHSATRVQSLSKVAHIPGFVRARTSPVDFQSGPTWAGPGSTHGMSKSCSNTGQIPYVAQTGLGPGRLGLPAEIPAGPRLGSLSGIFEEEVPSTKRSIYPGLMAEWCITFQKVCSWRVFYF